MHVIVSFRIDMYCFKKYITILHNFFIIDLTQQQTYFGAYFCIPKKKKKVTDIFNSERESAPHKQTSQIW